MNTTEQPKWNRAVLSVSWQADRHFEEHSITFERPTENNPSPDYPVVVGGGLSDTRLPMSSEWRHLFATVKVKAFDEHSLTVEYGIHEYTLTPGMYVKLDEEGMNYTTFWLYLRVEWGIDISGGEAFLRRFRLAQRMRMDANDVDALRRAAEKGNTTAKYAYGRWLYTAMPTDTAMQEAEELFQQTKTYIPDALASYALMLRHGDTKENVMDVEQADKLLRSAAQRGSRRAQMQQWRFRIFGIHCEADPKKVVHEIETLLATDPDPDPYLYILLGFAYELLDRTDDAIAQYELSVKKGEHDGYYWQACIYQQRGNMALYEELMEEGIRQGSALCCTFRSSMDEKDYQQLPPKEQRIIHNQLDSRLHQGLRWNESFCAYHLWLQHYYGGLGYKENVAEAAQYLKRGAMIGGAECIVMMAKLAENGDWPEPLTPTDIAELWLRAARYNPHNEESLRGLKRQSDPAFLLRHKDELQRYWEPKFQELHEAPEPPQVIQDFDEPDTPDEPEPLPEPMVIVIWPTGHLDLTTADVAKMKSYREMAQKLINAESLDAVHYSPLLSKVAEAAGLKQDLVMYVDRDAQMKNLPDNAIGTQLYGGAEVRGPIVICLQDQLHDPQSFTTVHDLVGTYTEINNYCGGLLIVKDDEDGRYDAWA